MLQRVLVSVLCALGLLAGPLALDVAPAFADPTVVNVYPQNDFQAMFRSATAGETMMIHGGNYTGFWVVGLNPASKVNIVGAPGEQVNMGPSSLIRSSNVSFQNLHFTDVLAIRTTNHVSIDSSSFDLGMQIRDGASDVAVTNSRITGGGDGIWVHNAMTTGPESQITIAGNDIYGQTDDAITVGVVNQLVIENNNVHDTIDTANHNDGVQVMGGNNITIRNNRFTNHDEALMIKGEPTLYGAAGVVTNLRVENNLISHNRGAGMILAGSTNTQIVNNTSYDNGLADLHLDGQNPGLQVWNNVLGQQYLMPGALAPSFENYNCVRNGGHGDRDITGDPTFVDHVDYHLAAASPCRGTAFATGAPADDFAGQTRLSPTDMGAWQDSSPTTNNVIEVANGQSIEAAIRQTIDGSTVLVHGGTYAGFSLTNYQWPTGVTMTAAPGETVTVGAITLDTVSNITFNGLTFTGPFTARNSSGLNVTNSTLVSVSLRDGTANTVISGNHISGGSYGVSVGNLATTARNHNVTISNNVVDHTTTDAIQIGAADNSVITNNVLDGTVDTSSFNVGIRDGGSSNLVISRNRLTGFDQAMSLYNDTTLGASNAVSNTRIENNLVTKSRGAGILLDTTQGSQVVNNTSWDNVFAGLHFAGQNTGLQAWNNVANSIYLVPGAAAPMYEDYNTQSWGGHGTHDLTLSDPGFVDHVDYHLATTSRCRGAGSPTGAPTEDLGGLPRTAPIDMGAWQD